MKPYDAPQSEPDQVKACKALWEDAREAFSAYHETFDEEYGFLYRFEHYERGNTNTTDGRRIRPRGRQLFSKHRRKVAQILKLADYLTTRPVDMVEDPDTSEDTRWLLEYELNNPRKKWKRVERRWVSLALAARVGVVKLEVDYTAKPFPEIYPRLVHPKDFLWDPNFQDPDDPMCPWVMEVCRMRIPDVEAMAKFGWKDTKGLRPDDGDRVTDREVSEATRISDFNGTAPSMGSWARQDRITVLKIWYRNDETRKASDTDQERDLDPRDWYLACLECGFRERTDDGSTLPEAATCPQCGGQMERIEREKLTEDVLAYPGGRLVVVAPLQERIFYDDGWPWQIRAAPYAVMRCYDIPFDAWGTSDTAVDWSYQVMSNVADRRLFETANSVGAILITGEGLVDPATGAPMAFTDEPVQLALWKGQGAPAVQWFSSTPDISGLLQVSEMADGRLRQDLGTGELGMTPESSKDIPVGTINAILESGEIPVDDHAQQLREAKAEFLGVWADLIRAVWTEPRMVRIKGPDGSEIWKRIKAATLPNVDVIVDTQPRWTAFDKEQASALRELMAVPPSHRALVAEAMNLPASWIRKLEEADQLQMQQAAMMGPGAVPPGGDPTGAMPGGPVPAPGPEVNDMPVGAGLAG